MLIISFLVLSVFTLSACGEKAFPRNAENIYIGTIAPQGRFWVFETDAGIFKISSTFLDLNPYLGKKIKIHGQFSKDTFFIDDVKIAQ